LIHYPGVSIFYDNARLMQFWCPILSFFLTCFVTVAVAQVPNVDWDKSLGGSNYEEIHSLTATQDGGVLAAMVTVSPGDGDITTDRFGSWDYWVVKLDQFGNEEWQQRFGGDEEDRLWVSTQTRDGGYLLGGSSYTNANGDKSEPSRGENDYWIVRLDPAGNLLWEKTFGGDGFDYLQGGVRETADGGFILAGYSDSNASGDKTGANRGEWDYWIVKTDAQGNLLWDKTYGGTDKELLYGLDLTTDGGFILAGASWSGVGGDKDDFLRGLNDAWLVKLDAAGDMQWQKTIGGNWEDVPYDIIQAKDGGYIFCALSGSDVINEKTEPKFGFGDYWIVKTDAQGNPIWDRVFGSDDSDTPYNLRENRRGNIMVAGVSHSDLGGNKSAPSKGLSDYWLVYLTAEGDLIWDETYGGADDDALTEMEFGPKGSIYLAGHSASGISGNRTEESRGFNDSWILKTECNVQSEVSDSLLILCERGEVELTATFYNCQDCLYRWQGNSDVSGANLTVTPNSTDIFFVTGIAANGCYNDDSIKVRINTDVPNSVELSSEYQLCSAAQVRIEEVKGGFAPYEFSLEGLPFSNQSVFDSLLPGDYLLSLQDADGCQLDTVFTIEPVEQLRVELGNDLEIQLGDSIRLRPDASRTITRTDWMIGDSTFCRDCPTTYVRPVSETLYRVEVTDWRGCKAQDALTVRVRKDRSIFMPSAFSPNGDGINDFFTIFGGTEVKRIKTMHVYDRWGQLLFEQYDFPPNQETLGWNGIRQGQRLKTGTYAFFVEVEFIDGFTWTYSGDVSLLY